VVSGRAERIPPARPERLWTQVPVRTVPAARGDGAALVVAGAHELRLPPAALQVASALLTMPALAVTGPLTSAVGFLVEHGVLAPRDLPERVIPADLGALDGWRFA
jgi:hypothetical protein